MDQAGLAAALATTLPQELADDLASQFNRDPARRSYFDARPCGPREVRGIGRASDAGARERGRYETQPSVDSYLRGIESRQGRLPDGLRICASRLARAMYALRSKRNIVHKSDVDPSGYDLRLLYAGAQWILTELLALAQRISGEQAARLIAEVQLPAGELLEVLGDRRLVYGHMTIREEALVHS